MQTKNKNIELLSSLNKTFHGPKAINLGWLMKYANTYNFTVPSGISLKKNVFKKILSITDIKTLLDRYYLCELLSEKIKVGTLIQEKIINTPHLNYLIANELMSFLTEYNNHTFFAVRSASFSEDSANKSSAGQYESYLFTKNDLNAILHNITLCYASFFSPSAITYRVNNTLDSPKKNYMSVIIQVMAPCNTSGVLFTLYPDTGLQSFITINAADTNGEMVVQGRVTPDEYIIAKQSLENNAFPVVKKTSLNNDYVLTEKQIIQLSQIAYNLSKAFKNDFNSPCDVDIEWTLDKTNNIFYILQIRPETIFNNKSLSYDHYTMNENKNTIIASGTKIGNGIATGTCIIAHTIQEFHKISQNDTTNKILVTSFTSPDWMEILKNVKGIITEKGGRTCHAAIVARELGIPTIIGVENATQLLQNHQKISLDCTSKNNGIIYEGYIAYEKKTLSFFNKKKNNKFSCIIANPDDAFSAATLPYDGVGLLRLEFIMSSVMPIHCNAIVNFTSLPHDLQITIQQKLLTYHKKKIALTQTDITNAYIDCVAQGIALIASAFYNKKCLIRFSDFKSNEYRNLLGGELYEMNEENPMMGLRGAARYIHPKFKDSFLLECDIINRVYEYYGLEHINVMIPFVRTPHEMKTIRDILLSQNVINEKKKTSLFMMVEIPSNILQLEQYAKMVDGFSIGSNDLTQFLCAADRDLSWPDDISIKNECVINALLTIIKKAKKHKKSIGICGQEIAYDTDIRNTLLKAHIDHISATKNDYLEILHTI